MRESLFFDLYDEKEKKERHVIIGARVELVCMFVWIL